MKTCKVCLEFKPLELFYAHKTGADKHRTECKSCNNAKKRRWESDNPEKHRNARRKAERRRRAENPEKYRALGRICDARRRAKKRDYKRKRQQTNVNFRLAAYLRTALVNRLKRRKGCRGESAISLLGCSVEDFKIYLESRFEVGMSWDNHSKSGWHIDHIIPCALFDLTKLEHRKRCFHFSNMQPLWATDNLAKQPSRSMEIVI